MTLGGIKGDSVKSILALVTVKSIVTPTITFLAVDQVVAWLEGTSDPLLSNFGLLLGSFPTALGVASYASEFNVCIDLVSTTIDLTTLASAPIMYSIANILTALHNSSDALARCWNFDPKSSAINMDKSIRLDHSWIDCIISLVAVTLTLALFLSKPAR